MNESIEVIEKDRRLKLKNVMKLFVLIYFLMTGTLVDSLKSPLTLGSDRVSFPSISLKFSPLIGAPDWLRIHVGIILTDGVDVNQKDIVLLDFIPMDATNPAVIRKMTLGSSVPGIVRIRQKSLDLDLDPTLLSDCIITDTETSNIINSFRTSTYIDGKTQESLSLTEDQVDSSNLISFLVSDFNDSINLFSNNCYHFAFHCITRYVTASMNPDKWRIKKIS